LLPGTLIDGRFEVEAAIGAGGMGVVYRAFDHRAESPVAIKILRGDLPMEVLRFERESAALAELHHPGIVRHVAHGATPDGDRYLVMEWLEGEDLKQRLARLPLSAAESLTVLRGAAAALAVAHARGWVHRDVKPGNLFLVGRRFERVVLLDFGIVRLFDGSDPLTGAGALVGTPGYMAPEQAKGLPARDARTDVFSLGCVLFECLTGRRAFKGASVVALLAKVQVQEVPSVRKLRPDLPEALDALVSRMLARAPEDRFADAAEVVRALDALADLTVGNTVAELDATRGGAEPADVTGPVAAEALTSAEQRVVSVVLTSARDAQGPPGGLVLAARDVERHGGRLSVLVNGSMLVTIWGAGSAVDRAVSACRSALCLRDRFPGVTVCVVTGRGVVSARVVAGSVIDRAAEALTAARPGAVQLDLTTGEMVAQRFLVASDGDALVLQRERARPPSTALLLGKPSAFVDRVLELSQLEALFSAAVEERSARAVLVTGAAGSGKSRLRAELVARLRRRGEPLEVLAGRADALGESAPFGIVADAVREAAGFEADEPLEARREKLAARLARHLEGPSLGRAVAFLGEMIGAPLPDAHSAVLRAARGNAHMMGDAMRAAWEEWLTAECEAQPVVLVLEDLHWGDLATVRLVDATLRNLEELPLLVVVLARPEIHARFPALWAARAVQEIKLGPLGRKASVALVRGALGAGARDELVARVVEHAEGNPFYLEELVRSVAAGREAFPDSVLGSVEARLDAEDTEQKRVLRAASVFGQRFSMRGVAALLGGDQELEHARSSLERLASRELVVAPGPSARVEAPYAFSQALVREAVYATLTDDDRALGHRLAGAWLEASGSTEAVPLAEHFVRGGQPRRAVPWFRRAAEQALAADDLAAATDHVGRGLACGAAGEDLAALRLCEAEARLWLGELALAEERGLEAAGLFRPGSEGWFHALYQVVVAAGKLGHVDHVEQAFASARGVVADPGALGAQISYLCACASNLIFGGRYAAASSAFEALAPLAPPDALSGALIAQARGFRASARGDAVACLEGLTAAFADFERAGDRRNACSTHVNLGFVLAELGDVEGAEVALRSALGTADRMGLQDLAAVARNNLGYALCCRGQLDEARRLLAQSIETLHRQRASRDEGLARTYLAQTERRAGDAAAAEREARAAVAVLDAIPSLRAFAVAVLSGVLLDQGHVAEALAAAGEAHAALAALGSVEEGEATIRLAHAEALAAAGRTREHRVALGEARDRLLERAARIGDRAFRARFLAGVPDHARTIALAASLEGDDGAAP
jgi:tetratricopeptide (TPR) repeat protein